MMIGTEFTMLVCVDTQFLGRPIEDVASFDAEDKAQFHIFWITNSIPVSRGRVCYQQSYHTKFNYKSTPGPVVPVFLRTFSGFLEGYWRDFQIEGSYSETVLLVMHRGYYKS